MILLNTNAKAVTGRAPFIKRVAMYLVEPVCFHERVEVVERGYPYHEEYEVKVCAICWAVL